MPLTMVSHGFPDVATCMPNIFALTLGTKVGKSDLALSASSIGRGGKREHVISGLEFTSTRESMPFTKVPRGVRDVARSMLHRYALTLGREVGK